MAINYKNMDGNNMIINHRLAILVVCLAVMLGSNSSGNASATTVRALSIQSAQSLHQ